MFPWIQVGELPQGITGIGKYPRIDVDNDLNNNLKSARIEINYTSGDVSGFNVSSLGVYQYNTTAWERLNDTGVNESERYVWANLPHFSDYAVGGTMLTRTLNITLYQGWNLISIPVSVF